MHWQGRELWELTQLRASGVLDVSEMPDFDEDAGGLIGADDEGDEIGDGACVGVGLEVAHTA